MSLSRPSSRLNPGTTMYGRIPTRSLRDLPPMQLSVMPEIPLLILQSRDLTAIAMPLSVLHDCKLQHEMRPKGVPVSQERHQHASVSIALSQTTIGPSISWSASSQPAALKARRRSSHGPVTDQAHVSDSDSYHVCHIHLP